MTWWGSEAAAGRELEEDDLRFEIAPTNEG
jgi:hypothetical protein